MTENIIQGDFSVNSEERVDEAPTWHTVLQVWRDVLASGPKERAKSPSPQWVNRIANSFKEMTYAKFNEFATRYFDKLDAITAILLEEIDTDEECLHWDTPELDVEHNSRHYKNLLLRWQEMFMGWEIAWDPSDEHAVEEIAAISESYTMLFGTPNAQGMTAYLDNIKFELTEADQAEIRDNLNNLREAAQ